MTTLYAKSVDRGGETLTQHTEQVLRRLTDQIRLHPSLPDQLGMPHLWDWLYWGAFLHDFGKTAEGFQLLLKGIKGDWSDQKHRHEALSLLFVDWLFPKGDPHRPWVMAVIATHHKDSSYMREMYGGTLSPSEQYLAKNVLSDGLNKIIGPYLKTQIEEETQKCLWKWLSNYGHVWAEQLGIPLTVARTANFAFVDKPGVVIFKALHELYQWQKSLTPHEQVVAHLVRGLILTADHAASAGTPVFPSLPLTLDNASKPLKERTIRHHQREMQQITPIENHWTLLIAPTGSGKTEAALLWAAVQHMQQPAARLFYTLPYQASMNAMADRLLKAYFTPASSPSLTLTSQENTILTIQHSRATLKFFQQHMDAEPDPRLARDKADARKNLGNLNFHPVRVFSPYQMLKAAYRLKGYETLLLDYVDALFIFDEIHAYEPKRLALILSFMGWLVTHYNARCLFMTATLPPLVHDALTQMLGTPRIVRADQTTFIESQRHRVHVLAGEIFGYVDDIVERFHAGQSVLVVCNTVNRAQELYSLLQVAGLTDKPEDTRELLLLHGRFNGRDRRLKEEMLMRRVGVGKQPRKPIVVVATQVVEVSLDVDFDTLYTDPAPLEALVQRFGRVNRGRKEHKLCDVFVCERPIGEKESRPYDVRPVELAIQQLMSYEGQALDEAHVTTMLETIYRDNQIATQWREDYDKTRQEFSNAILDTMIPFESADSHQMRAFYALFDGIDVLPADLANAYSDAREKEGWLSASQYAVNINWGQYCMMKTQGLIQLAEEDDYLDQVFVTYDAEAGLQFNKPLTRTTPLNPLFISDDDL